MSDSTPRVESEGTPEFEEGRYVFCAVALDGGDRPVEFDAEGIDGGPVRVVTSDGLGAVVQPVESVFDSGDPTEVRRWLLAHQSVVDDAGRAFGTPLPFRFDTIVRGDDETVAAWLDERESALREALAWLSGRWEYRIELRWDEAAVAERAREEDGELRQLAARVESASEGTGFLLQKQYDQRLAGRLRERSERLESALFERVEPHAVDVRVAGGGSSSRVAADAADAASDDELETAVRLTLLADGDREQRIGEELEAFAERPDLDVRYTGPWPPYSFAPDVDAGEEGP